MKRIPIQDLEYISDNCNDIWDSLRGKSIFLTGGTGFFGKWILESFIYVNEKLSLNAKLTILSRNPDLFLIDNPHYLNYPKCVNFLKGDILTFDFKLNQKFEFIIHAATAASDSLNKTYPLLMIDTITLGTRKVLDFALKQPIEGFLFISSGAIYGQQPENILNIRETDCFKIDINNSNSAYSEGKRIAELYCSIYSKLYSMPIKLARCFAFVGPFLPLTTHFAIGNFIKNVLNKEKIVIKSNGKTIRSYMYASDLIISLFKILISGKVNQPYNVGSDKSYSLLELASIISDIYGNGYQLLESTLDQKVNIYVPNIDLIKSDFNITDLIPIDVAIRKTVEFYTEYE